MVHLGIVPDHLEQGRSVCLRAQDSWLVPLFEGQTCPLRRVFAKIETAICVESCDVEHVSQGSGDLA